MSTVLDALAKAEGEGKDTRPEGSALPPEPPRRRPPVLLGLLVVLALVLGAFVFGLLGPEEDAGAPVAQAPGAESRPVPAVVEVARSAAQPDEPAPARRSQLPGPEVAQPPENEVSAPPAQAVRRAPVAGSVGAQDVVAPPPPQGENPMVARREEQRADRERRREERLARRSEMLEARELMREGKLTPEEFRDLRRGERERNMEARAARQLARREARREEIDAANLRGKRPVAGTGDPAAASTDPPAGDSSQPAAATSPPLTKPVDQPGLPSHKNATPPLEVATPAVPVAELPPSDPPPDAKVRRWVPGGVPQVSIQILQWSTDDQRRFAYVSVDGGRATQVREGDRVGDLTVTRIYREVVEFEHSSGPFLLRAN